MDTVGKLTTCYRKLTGSVLEGTWFAPGWVNLIGEHTDYNDGLALPFALGQRAFVAAGHRDDGLIVIYAMDLSEIVELPLSNLNPGGGGWAAHLAGVLWALREAGHQVGAVNLMLTSGVPLGAGLPSFAAVEYAVMAAACDLFGLEIAPMERARLAQRAEDAYVGVPTGLLDQAASTLCHAGHGLFMDCRTLETAEVPLLLREQGVEVLAFDIRTPHSHVDGKYGERRATCKQAAMILGIRVLHDAADLDTALARLPDEWMRKWVRHVVTENGRTRAVLELAAKGNLAGIASLLNESHVSMRDDYEVTVPTIDPAMETALAQGTLGARMTGGGFGDYIIAWCLTGRAEHIGSAIWDAFKKAGFLDPSWFAAVPSEGAGRLKRPLNSTVSCLVVGR